MDGGANRWLQFVRSQTNENCYKLPDLITGDFDSITAETTEYYAKRGIKRVHTPDQNHTDFSKAVDVIKPILKDKQVTGLLNKTYQSLNFINLILSDKRHYCFP